MQHDVTSVPGRNGLSATRRELLALAALGMAGVRPALAAAAPSGQLTYGVHISLAPTWFDPAETPSLVTPYMLYYALHDGMLKAMPDELMAHSLAESWSATEDGMSYSFVAARRGDVPQRRARDGGGCEVLLRALSWCRQGAAA